MQPEGRRGREFRREIRERATACRKSRRSRRRSRLRGALPAVRCRRLLRQKTSPVGAGTVSRSRLSDQESAPCSLGLLIGDGLGLLAGDGSGAETTIKVTINKTGDAQKHKKKLDPRGVERYVFRVARKVDTWIFRYSTVQVSVRASR